MSLNSLRNKARKLIRKPPLSTSLVAKSNDKLSLSKTNHARGWSLARENLNGLGAIVRLTPTMRQNEDKNGVELIFSGKPTEETRQALKEVGFRWSEKQQLWYARRSEKVNNFVDRLLETGAEVDDTQYEKHFFYKKVASRDEYDRLPFYTEFALDGRFYKKKKELENYLRGEIGSALASGRLRYKKFYSKPVTTEATPTEASPIETEEEFELSDLEAEIELEIELERMRQQARTG